jgi:hypothetical protein
VVCTTCIGVGGPQCTVLNKRINESWYVFKRIMNPPFKNVLDIGKDLSSIKVLKWLKLIFFFQNDIHI